MATEVEIRGEGALGEVMRIGDRCRALAEALDGGPTQVQVGPETRALLEADRTFEEHLDRLRRLEAVATSRDRLKLRAAISGRERLRERLAEVLPAGRDPRTDPERTAAAAELLRARSRLRKLGRFGISAQGLLAFGVLALGGIAGLVTGNPSFCLVLTAAAIIGALAKLGPKSAVTHPNPCPHCGDAPERLTSLPPDVAEVLLHGFSATSGRRCVRCGASDEDYDRALLALWGAPVGPAGVATALIHAVGGAFEQALAFGREFEGAADALHALTPATAVETCSRADALFARWPQWLAVRAKVQESMTLASPRERALLANADAQHAELEARLKAFLPPGDDRALAAKWAWARERLIVISTLEQCRRVHAMAMVRATTGWGEPRCPYCKELPPFLAELAEPIRAALARRKPSNDACGWCGLSPWNFDEAIVVARKLERPLRPRPEAG